MKSDITLELSLSVQEACDLADAIQDLHDLNALDGLDQRHANVLVEVASHALDFIESAGVVDDDPEAEPDAPEPAGSGIEVERTRAEVIPDKA